MSYVPRKKIPMVGGPIDGWEWPFAHDPEIAMRDVNRRAAGGNVLHVYELDTTAQIYRFKESLQETPELRERFHFTQWNGPKSGPNAKDGGEGISASDW